MDVHCQFLENVQCVNFVYTLHKHGKDVMKSNSSWPYKMIVMIPGEEQLKVMEKETIDKSFCINFFNKVLKPAMKTINNDTSLVVDDTASFYDYTAWGEILSETQVIHLFQRHFLTTNTYPSLRDFVIQSHQHLSSLFKVGMLSRDVIERNKLTDSYLNPKDHLKKQGSIVHPIILKGSNDDVEGTIPNGNDGHESKTSTIDDGVKMEKDTDVTKIVEVNSSETTESMSSQDGNVMEDIDNKNSKNDTYDKN